jgi:hypothetical protein
MPDIQSPNPATESPANAGATSHDTEHDHTSRLAALKKMSTTAGLGSGDYAAVSPVAIFALVASVLGLLVVVWEYLAALGVIGLICGIIALRQINRSNGTQTGRGLAWVAIVIGAGVTAWIAGSKILNEVRTRPHREQVLQLISSLDSACAKGDYRAAYQLFSPTFRDRVNEEEFLRTLTGNPAFGSLVGVSWNNEIVYYDVGSAGPKAAVAGGLFRFRLVSDTTRQPIEFSRDDEGKWKIQDLSMMFPPKKQ